MSQVIAPWFTAARAWIDQYCRYVLDHSEHRRRLLERKGSLKEETKHQWWEAYEELTDLGRALLLDLDLLIPRVPDDLKGAFESVKALLTDLHLAIHNVGSEKDTGEPGGTSPYEDDLLRARIHHSRVHTAVGPCQEIALKLNVKLDQWASGSSTAAGGSKRVGLRPDGRRSREKAIILSEFKRRLKADRLAPGPTEEAGCLLRWFEKVHPELNAPARKTIYKDIQEQHRTWRENQQAPG